jgi:GT2 family glycosyltransferase
MDVSIIIVAYNSEQTITDCINSVIDTVKKHSYEILISDNSRNDNTKDLVKKQYKENVIYFQNEDNLGFSKGNNRAVVKSKGKYVLFLNPDTKVYKGTIDGMLDFMKENPQCGVSTCFVELPDGSLDDSAHRGFPTPWRAFSHFTGLSKAFPKSKIFAGYNLTYLDLTKTHEIEAAAGSFMLVPRNVGEEIGWWDEDYFFYGEDIDFCYTVKHKGYKIYFVPEFRALHMKGISSGIKKVSQNVTKASAETRKFATHHRFRAMEIFYDKHYKDSYPFFVTALVKLGIKLKRKTA